MEQKSSQPKLATNLLHWHYLSGCWERCNPRDFSSISSVSMRSSAFLLSSSRSLGLFFGFTWAANSSGVLLSWLPIHSGANFARRSARVPFSLASRQPRHIFGGRPLRTGISNSAPHAQITIRGSRFVGCDMVIPLFVRCSFSGLPNPSIPGKHMRSRRCPKLDLR